ncbi:MAG: SDR family oxidoreductase [Tissierellia bacterium]|nr:SDR family oxidoreductase [Tissierellia bacterium]
MKNLFDLSGKVALVTGASSGLGVQFAKVLAENGADIAILARREDRLKAVKDEIEAIGVKCHYVVCDVLDVKQIEDAVKDVEEHYGKIDILVNNAGFAIGGPSEDISNEDWKKIVDINLNAPFFFAREVGKGMIKRGYGKIINIGSIHSEVARLDVAVTGYATTKGGIKMLTKSLAVDWAKKGITVNAIGPGYFPSEMTEAGLSDPNVQLWLDAYSPMGRTGRDGELNGALLLFASDASSHINGQLLLVDGGWTAI